jgi:phosphatidylinositol alpha-1,6-mannosyltransferase
LRSSSDSLGVVPDAGFRRPRVLLLVVEQRFYRTPRGDVWTTGHYPYAFFLRYLQAFDEVRVLSRMIPVPAPPASSAPSGGPGVTHLDIPDYRGLTGLIPRAPVAVARAFGAARTCDAVIVRSPSSLGAIPACVGRLRKTPVGVEVIGDPEAVFARGVFVHPIRPLLRSVSSCGQAWLCRHATAVMYVSDHLRQRYGSRGATFVGSDCALPDEAFVNVSRRLQSPGRMRIINVGTFEQPYKGQDVLLRCVRSLVAEARDVEVVVDFVGTGRHQASCMALAKELGILRNVNFHGHVSSVAALRALLDGADVMVHPSRTEGMPRVIIEAMARGLPCVATRVGGIPELLDREWLVGPDDCDAIVRALLELWRSPELYAAQSGRNLRASHAHSERLSRLRYSSFIESLTCPKRSNSPPLTAVKP